MRNWVCAIADIGVAVAATQARAHNSLRTFINSSQKKAFAALDIGWPSLGLDPMLVDH
jgi:hypothetical protein